MGDLVSLEVLADGVSGITERVEVPEWDNAEVGLRALRRDAMIELTYMQERRIKAKDETYDPDLELLLRGWVSPDLGSETEARELLKAQPGGVIRRLARHVNRISGLSADPFRGSRETDDG